MNSNTILNEDDESAVKAVYDLADIGCHAVFKKSLTDAASLAGRPFTAREIVALAMVGVRSPLNSEDNALE